MADFDSEHGDDAQGDGPHGDGQYPGVDRITFLEHNFQNVVNELNYLRNVVARPPPPPPRPNLNLPQPAPFSGLPSDLQTFKLKLFQYLIGNQNTYTESESQLLLAGSLLIGSAGQWYSSLVDPHTLKLPPHYTLDSFFVELEDFFGVEQPLESSSFSRRRRLQPSRPSSKPSPLPPSSLISNQTCPSPSRPMPLTSPSGAFCPSLRPPGTFILSVFTPANLPLLS